MGGGGGDKSIINGGESITNSKIKGGDHWNYNHGCLIKYTSSCEIFDDIFLFYTAFQLYDQIHPLHETVNSWKISKGR